MYCITYGWRVSEHNFEHTHGRYIQYHITYIVSVIMFYVAAVVAVLIQIH